MMRERVHSLDCTIGPSVIFGISIIKSRSASARSPSYSQAARWSTVFFIFENSAKKKSYSKHHVGGEIGKCVLID